MGSLDRDVATILIQMINGQDHGVRKCVGRGYSKPKYSVLIHLNQNWSS